MEQSTSRRRRIEGYPRGWFVVAFSDEIKPREVQSHRYFGRKLALFRDEAGTAHLLDADCPHLGANLARGKVVDGALECPFHAWRFAADGSCVHIPYSDAIPQKAAARSWLLKETNGIIFVWYDPRGGAPDFDVPHMPEAGDGRWTAWSHSALVINTHSREIVENVVDVAHFAPVHRTVVETFENEFTDHMAIQRTKGVAYPRGGGKDYFTITATYYGPGFQISQMSGYLESRLINAHTMVGENSLKLHFGVMLRNADNPRQTERFSQLYVDNLTQGFHEDIAIWEDKTYRDVPLLCKGDGPIMKLRKWYAQFYSDPNDGGAPAV